MSLRPAIRFFAIIFLSLPAFPQNFRLPYRPIGAEWNSALNRIVMVSTSPSQLHLFDPVTQATQSVNLNAAPVSLSLSPDGLFAAVGHTNSASYVDLTSRTVTRTYPYPNAGPAGQSSVVVLAAQWLYVLPTYVSDPVSINLATGAATSLSFTYSSGGRLHPSGTAIYTTRDGISGNGLQRFDISPAGTLAPAPSPSLSDYPSCGGIWFSPDGARIYTGCGTAARYNADPQQDRRYFGRFFSSQVRSFSESVNGRIAVIPSPSGSSSPAQAELDTKVVLINSNGFQEQGRLTIPSFPVATRSFAGQGRWTFFNNTGSALYVIYQAETASGLLNDFAVQTYNLANPAPCNATFAVPTLTVGSDGALTTAAIQAPSDCIFNATSNADWIQVLSGGFGSGNAILSLHVRANTAAQARTGTITLGSQTLQISQQAAPTTIPAQQLFSYNLADAAYSTALDRVVLVSSTLSELHLYDPITRADQFVPLSAPALSVALSPNGRKAAVGHASAVSIVNLETRAVEKLLPTTFEATSVLLAGDTWVYAFSTREGQVIEISTGTARQISTPATFARRHSSNDFAYLGSNFSGWSRLNIRDGATGPVTSSSNSVSTCGNFWTSEDGRRVYTACGGVFRSSESPTEDGVPNGTMSGVSQNSGVTAAWVTHSAARQQFAALSTTNSNNAALLPDLQLYGDDGLPLLGRVALRARADGAASLPTRGRWVFWNQAGTRLFAISQVNTSSLTLPAFAPISEFAVETIPVDALLACSLTVSPTSVNVPGVSGSGTITVQTGPSCLWTAEANPSSFWLRISGSSSPYSHTGTGPGTFTFSYDFNSTGAPRTATLNVGATAVTVNQAVPDPITLSPTAFNASASGTYNSVNVAANTPTLQWSIVTSASWISILSPANLAGAGSSGILYRVDPNTGPARTGTITVGGQTLTITQAGASLPNGMRFVPITPCRIVDTRGATGETGPFGAPVMEPATQRDFPIPTGRCLIPSAASAYSVNVTVVPRGPLAYLTLWPTGQPRPLVSTLNSYDGRIKANAAIVPAGANGSISTYVTDRTDVILDINGYFVPANLSGAPFYPITPCRVADTRSSTMVAAGQTRTFNIGGTCGGIPFNASAFSLNITAIPRSGGLSYLTVWPTGSPRPTVSTLNSPTGTVVANAAIVPSGINGSITIFATDDTDIVIDSNGFFGGSISATPLNFYPLAPCRVSDTRNANGNFGGPIILGTATRTIPVQTSTCNVPAQAAAYSLNATVVPNAMLQYLTIWPTGVAQPTVSTLNAFDAAITSNALIAPAGFDRSINAFMSEASHLILDINGFFAP